MNRYKCSLCDIFRPNISRIGGFIVKRVSNYSTVSSLQQANFLRECVMCEMVHNYVLMYFVYDFIINKINK